MSEGLHPGREVSGQEAPPAWALDALVGSALVAFLVVEEARITYVSPGMLALAGWDGARGPGPVALPELFGDTRCARRIAGLSRPGDRYRDFCMLRGADGAEIAVTFDAVRTRTGRGPCTVLMAADVGAAMRSHTRLQQLAFHDPLTGLANRVLLGDRMEQAIAAARRTSGSFTVMLVDLDRFKPVNDLHGHASGDRVLRETSRRLQAATRAVDTVARLGGDEFVVLLGGGRGRDEAALVARRIIEAVNAPLDIPGLRLGTSIGIAVFPGDGADQDQLLARADGAMYDAKRQGGNCYAFAQGEGALAHPRVRLVWLPQYRIGIEAIDRQHEDLVTRMNALWEALLAHQGRDALLRGLAAMTAQLEAHFVTEEAHMDAHPYDGAAAHRAEHRRALDTARKLAAHLDEQSLALGIRFLYDWLLSHIRSYDADLPHVSPS